MTKLGAARIGISGWRYAPWRGDFYPSGLPQKSELAFAARAFDTIELNGSFYSLQRPENFKRWYEDVPDDFLFAVKGSRYITHMLRLRNVRTALANFYASGLFELREKLGPFLWQFPPSFIYDRERLEAFFELLPHSGRAAAKLARAHDDRVTGRSVLRIDSEQSFRHAIEVRHESFMQAEFIQLLRDAKVALVVADTAGRWPFMEDVTADFIYVRLHGDKKLYESGYTTPALRRWAAKVDAWRRGGEAAGAKTIARPDKRRSTRDVYVYFDNDMKVHAPYDATALAKRVTRLGMTQNI